MATARLPEGQYTATIYTLIKEQKYAEASRHLQAQLQHFPSSRAALSLQAYCTFFTHDYDTAADWCVFSKATDALEIRPGIHLPWNPSFPLALLTYSCDNCVSP